MAATTEYITERRRRRRRELHEMLGGCCAKCGSKENLEFDHIDRATKVFQISAGLNKNWDLLVAEAKKCQLLCSDCHHSKTAAEVFPDHGTISRRLHRKHPCKCDLCRAAFSAWQKQYRAKKKLLVSEPVG